MLMLPHDHKGRVGMRDEEVPRYVSTDGDTTGPEYGQS